MKINRNDAGKLILEKISQEELQKYQKHITALTEIVHDEYHYYSEQMRKRFNDLCESLLKNSKPLHQQIYHRAVHTKYVNQPLSAQGSVIHESGGRFNYGSINPNIPKFPGLYLAGDVETALREKYQPDLSPSNQADGLTLDELALIGKKSMASFKVSVFLEKIVDIRERTNLHDFHEIISKIRPYQSNKSIRLDQKTRLIKALAFAEQWKTLETFYESLFIPNFQWTSLYFDIPALSQMLGHVAHEAGIQAILYPSKMTQRDCLVVYPMNFYQSKANVWLDDDDIPSHSIHDQYRITEDNYKLFC